MAEAFPEYDFSDLTAKQIKKLSNYGAILDKIRKVVRAVKKQAPKAIRASLALLDEFGSPETQDKVAKARRAAAIVKGAGPKPPGHKLRKLCN